MPVAPPLSLWLKTTLQFCKILPGDQAGKTTGSSTQQMLIKCLLSRWPLIIRPQNYFLSKYFSCDYTMHKFQGFQVNLQHLELICKSTSHHNWDAHGESEYLKEAVLTPTVHGGRINATWHVKNALPSAITIDENISGYHMNDYLHITSSK